MDNLVTGMMAAEVVNEIMMGRGTTKTMSTWQTIKKKHVISTTNMYKRQDTHTQQPADQTELMTINVS